MSLLQENAMTSNLIALAASLALLAGCASGGRPTDDKPPAFKHR
jgi:uncharacterized lipoprotein YajG